jgi:hypothetical protein
VIQYSNLGLETCMQLSNFYRDGGTHLHLRIVTVVLLLVPLLTILAFSRSTGIPFLSASYSLSILR